MAFSYDLKIPKDRVAVLIGKNGETKKEIEESTKTHLDIDSKEGDVIISGDEAIDLFAVREMIRAIGRGFNPDTARLLLKQDYAFEMISLNDYSKQKTHLLRLKGRVIGQDGKSRKTIEDLTECFISVYGKTISLIGRVETINIARRAVESLLAGSTHAAVYKWLEKQRRETKHREFADKEAFDA